MNVYFAGWVDFQRSYWRMTIDFTTPQEIRCVFGDISKVTKNMPGQPAVILCGAGNSRLALIYPVEQLKQTYGNLEDTALRDRVLADFQQALAAG